MDVLEIIIEEQNVQRQIPGAWRLPFLLEWEGAWFDNHSYFSKSGLYSFLSLSIISEARDTFRDIGIHLRARPTDAHQPRPRLPSDEILWNCQ